VEALCFCVASLCVGAPWCVCVSVCDAVSAYLWQAYGLMDLFPTFVSSAFSDKGSRLGSSEEKVKY